MQIRLTVLAPRSGHAAVRACDVLVTAPAGTALAAVASGLATAVSGPDAPGAVVVYSGRERLDAQRCALGEPPLIDGAVVSLQLPGPDDTSADDVPAQLQVVAGPDAGGVHLLHGGQIRIGRSADADVPLDDPDVSRLHCAVTVAEDGSVTVADLCSTNGTWLEGSRIGERPVALASGALLRIGESALRLAPGIRAAGLPTAPDGEGHLRLAASGPPPGAPATDAARAPGDETAGEARAAGPTTAAYGTGGHPATARAPGPRHASGDGPREPAPAHGGQGGGPAGPAGAADGGAAVPYRPGRTSPIPGPEYGASQYGNPPGAPRVPDPRGADTHYGARLAPPPGAPGAAPGSPDAPGDASGDLDSRTTRTARTQQRSQRPAPPRSTHSRAVAPDGPDGPDGAAWPQDGGRGDEGPHGHSRTSRTDGPGGAAARTTAPSSRRQDTPPRGTAAPEAADAPDQAARRRGIGAWARRLAGSRGEEQPEAAPGPLSPAGAAGRAPRPETWPDPAAVLLTALGPGPRLWERGSRHAEALAVRLGTADRPAADGRGALPLVPVTVGLREAGSLGLAGPRERLTGLTRWAVAQLAALHSPADLEIVLISADRALSLEQRRRDWGWLGWLPHVRPAHGQDCRLLLAFDRDQAAARITELTRRLDDGPLGSGWASADPWTVTEAGARHHGPHTLVIVDGDPGSAALRESAAQLAGAGAAAGVHLICLAETPSASPDSPIAATYETACAASLPFRECGAVALLSGDVATALRLLRTAVGQPAGHGTVAVVDAVSPAWAERFGRALAPLRAAVGSGRERPAAALPRSSRLLDELGLARATPASLMARWASAADRTDDCTVVLGTGPRGPVSFDLLEEGPHLLIEGPTGSGRTELLRSIAASLAAAARPDRLGLLLVDGAGGERDGAAGGLSVCTDLPHVTEHLVASDPVRMRHFAQALGAELKRRAELLGRLDFAEWHSRRETADRVIGQRRPGAAEQRAARRGDEQRMDRRGDEQRMDRPRADQSRQETHRADQSRQETHRADQRADQRPGRDSASGGALRLRPDAVASMASVAQERGRAEEEPSAALPRLVVLVDDFDALVAPALGSPGRPAAGSVVRALEAVAREGERLGVHLVAASARPERTVDTELAHGARLRVVLDAPPVAPGPDEPAPGRGRLGHPDGRVTPFQGGRVTGRIPRTATLRPTVVVLEWERMGDPPARRPVRELGNGPTDLALLASALERAARSVGATPSAPLTPAHP
ncbi:FtsK/SpoIIIE domain-containing protein [Streptomyces corynorhini]|uniref:FHA domain-containing protein n=1 Tax=Streptomyces corynorhini TaxID=2282652 RepID=A0A370BA70_9ACTN|nr:FtsK/SpoIIIE domain-containing protein [Streptomyces corynorhini]RDG38687.1 FHA domain-containing protein [Streptomyces corynorhini]